LQEFPHAIDIISKGCHSETKSTREVDMPFIQAGDVKLNYVEYGKGDNIVVFIHGNLACVNWMDLIWPRIPENIHAYALDWRGCGDSDKPVPTKDYGNYSIKQHAADMLNSIGALGIKKCGLATHSTGGIISTYMLLEQPKMFDKVLSLDPASPRGLELQMEYTPFFQALKDSREVTFNALASVAPSLFIKESLNPEAKAQFQPNTTKEQRDLFHLLVDKTRVLSDGVWFGTAYHLAEEYKKGELVKEAYKIKQPHLVLWGENDVIISRADMEEMSQLLPDCRLRIIKDTGHCLNIENPDLYAEIFMEFFGN
jgi:pimeloyl-ACP methyl ester carboxylesterase